MTRQNVGWYPGMVGIENTLLTPLSPNPFEWNYQRLAWYSLPSRRFVYSIRA